MLFEAGRMKGSPDLRGPKMTAFHIMMLSASGLPEMPIGGSDARRLKSRIRRRLAGVDCCQHDPAQLG